MFNKYSGYSYAAQKHKRHRFLKILILFIVFFIIYNCFTAFLFSVWVVDNNTMQPGLQSGERVIFSSFVLPWNRNDENPLFKRGSVVLVDMRYESDHKLPMQIVDSVVRFFTAQRISIFTGRGQYYIKRVIALPGDEVSMTGYVMRVKASGSTFSLTEYELSQSPYHPAIPNTSDLWNESVPFSGSMDTIILGPGECFVVSDDRSNTNDSRTWGPISTSLISARAVFRFWPLNRIGLF